MDCYKDLIGELGMQDKAKYKHCCLKGILVPKAVDFASQFAHFRQLQGQQQQKQQHLGSISGSYDG